MRSQRSSHSPTQPSSAPRTLALIGLTLSVALCWSPAVAQVDHAGADFSPASGTILSADQVNIGRFVVAEGATVNIEGTVRIQAAEILIEGILDASGTGPIGGFERDECFGDDTVIEPLGSGRGGAGGYGDPWPTSQCSGGAGHGGMGGRAELLTDLGSGRQLGFGGTIYGAPSSRDLEEGSGGGRPDVLCCPCESGRGGRGGGAIGLYAWTSVEIAGTVRANGGNGSTGPSGANAGAGGGGSGGTVLIDTRSLMFLVGGRLEARGGDGALRMERTGNGSIGGGGGGGRIKIFAARDAFMGTLDVGGGGMAPMAGIAGTDGGATSSMDLDGDDVLNGDDACMADFFDDADGDGLCANVDPCPSDSTNDVDGDGLCPADDNCPLDANPGQDDLDLDNVGDVCDPDIDGDGLDNGSDNCPLNLNPSQSDRESDGFGDVCDLCPDIASVTNIDTNGDGEGDDCDDDDDGDGVLDEDDLCPLVAGEVEGCPMMPDAGMDAGASDAGASDAGASETDAGATDAGVTLDAGPGTSDASPSSVDVGLDAGTTDAGFVDRVELGCSASQGRSGFPVGTVFCLLALWVRRRRPQ